MARARNLKPSFFTNDLLAEIDPLGRLLFQGLWCHADRDGRLEYRPKKLKAEILPYDNCAIEALFDALEERGFIFRYAVCDSVYIQVVNFAKHQNPHVKEAASSIPAPVKHGASTVQAQEKTGASPASSLFPLPLTLNPLPSSGASADAERDPEYPKAFVAFWESYPRKKAKGDALKAWKRIKPSERLADEILQAVQRAKTSADWLKDNGQFIPYPASWLNARGWEDELGTPTGGPARPWHESASGIEAKGAELGVPKRDGEPFHAFKTRVFRAAGLEVAA